ncbi:MAG: alcohol dehydrogenase [Myxococcaceae bacterium]|nr:alcohol dehydrogenase [Myxococcaceae bacterium]
MSCAHAYLPVDGGEGVFTLGSAEVTFGRGALREVGALVRALGARRVALFTDRVVADLEPVDRVRRSLAAAGVDAAVYADVRVEPTDASFLDAARFAAAGRFDGYVSVGGGSVIDTCKAAALYARWPADFLAYVNAPVGEGRAVPGPLPPHVACPTTSGTGSELTGIAVCDVLALRAKTGIASRWLRPARAVVDPDATRSLPAAVVAASGFDVLCHAIESYTARPYTARGASATPGARPMSQGANPWSDLGSVEALRLGGKYLVRAVHDAADDEAREQMMWAATLAGVAFGNAGVHLPHAMAYAVAGLVRDYHPEGYPAGEPMVPHGVSVVAGAPAAFRFTAALAPERHLAAAALLGADVRGAAAHDAGALLAAALGTLMRAARVPVDLRALGYGEADVDALVGGTIVQARLLDNAPRRATRDELAAVFRDALDARGPA